MYVTKANSFTLKYQSELMPGLPMRKPLVCLVSTPWSRIAVAIVGT